MILSWAANVIGHFSNGSSDLVLGALTWALIVSELIKSNNQCFCGKECLSPEQFIEHSSGLLLMFAIVILSSMVLCLLKQVLHYGELTRLILITYMLITPAVLLIILGQRLDSIQSAYFNQAD